MRTLQCLSLQDSLLQVTISNVFNMPAKVFSLSLLSTSTLSKRGSNRGCDLCTYGIMRKQTQNWVWKKCKVRRLMNSTPCTWGSHYILLLHATLPYDLRTLLCAYSTPVYRKLSHSFHVSDDIARQKWFISSHDEYFDHIHWMWLGHFKQ